VKRERMLSALDDLPFCEVIKREYLRTPRGGLLAVTYLACGARTWRNVRSEARRPKTRIACMSCWVALHSTAPELPRGGTGGSR
jgi:hypothetical protein